MKKIVQGTLLLFLTCFSFFYTDKVINLINAKDPIMIELINDKSFYEVAAVNAIYDDDTIIPGINGREVDIDKSYNKMKIGGVFREELLVFKDIFPKESLYDNKNKYIVKGNDLKNEVAVIIVFNNKYIDKFKDVDNVTLFFKHKDINTKNINLWRNKEIYNYGNNGNYDEQLLFYDNILINRLANNKSKYCLVKNKNQDVLDLCNENDMYVVLPNIIGDYYDVRNNLYNGSIILIENYNNIDIIVKYIKSKGYDIVTLNKLLSE